VAHLAWTTRLADGLPLNAVPVSEAAAQTARKWR
jgi:hypothetical protein